MSGSLPRPRVLRFVTGNRGKLLELQGLLAPLGWRVEQDARGYPELQADTLAEVCRFGADHLLAAGLPPPFVLEDSGLFVDALKGFPGPYSRHALETLGLAGFLRLLEGVPPPSRTARFESCLHLVDPEGGHHDFHGRCPGAIAPAALGTGGFGYDPVFIPDGHARTFGQMAQAEKSAASHRGQAVRLLVEWFNKAVKR